MLHQHIPGSGKRHYQVADRGLTVDRAYLDREDRMIVWQDGRLRPVSGSRDAWDDRALVRGFESTFLSRALSTGLGRLNFLGSLFAFPFFLLSIFLAIWFTTRSGRSLLLWGVDSDINARKRGSSSSRARPPTRWVAPA